MGKKKIYKHPDQLDLFDLTLESQPNISTQEVTSNLQLPSQSGLTTEIISSNEDTNVSESNILFLPETYESIVKKIGKDNARLFDFIVPVNQFEKKIIQVIADIDNSGYLVFLYGVSGVGKSTFTGSLKLQKHIPVQKIVSIDASELSRNDASELDKNTNQKNDKLKILLETIRIESEQFFKNNNQDTSKDKLCIVIEYLEHLRDEDQSQVIAFFRDLNQFLRKYGVLIIWPITERSDLKNMQDHAKSFSSTIFHSRIPYIDFTGPLIDEYPTIAKKTIMFFNSGKTCYEFQLTDNDFEELKQVYLKKPKEKHLIRDYLQDVKKIWQDKTNYLVKVVSKIPKPMEVWFIFPFPYAEQVVAGFAKKTPDIPNEMWNADYRSLYAYITEHNQRKADWSSERLTFALTSPMLTTKIMYLPTNALISCIAAYAQDVRLQISKEDLLNQEKYNIPSAWFSKYAAQKALKSTPLYLQVLELQTSGNQSSLDKPKFRAGKRKSGKVKEGLENAKQAFDLFNTEISTKKISDHSLNKSLCLALKDVLENYESISIESEKFHPYLTNIRPDISIQMQEKIICIEMCYTKDNTPGNLADYVLRKLNTYMKQLESMTF